MTDGTLPYTRTPSDLYSFHQAVSGEVILKLAEQVITERFTRGMQITEPMQTARLIKMQLAPLERQVLAILMLDQQHRVIALSPVCFGSVNQTKAYPREMIKTALKHNAAALILAQNQPSGIAKPGPHDAQVSKALQKVLAYLDITLLDHLIIGGNEVLSLSEEGLFDRNFSIDDDHPL